MARVADGIRAYNVQLACNLSWGIWTPCAVPVKDVALHAKVALEFGEQVSCADYMIGVEPPCSSTDARCCGSHKPQFKMLNPDDERSIDQLGAVHLYTQGCESHSTSLPL
jgi:hypothetical protein